jgi:hypothetical protein
MMKYLIAASWLRRSRRARPARTYSEIDRISSATNRMIASLAAPSRVMPIADSSTSGSNSPRAMPRSRR